MSQLRLLSMLYDLTLAIGGEVTVRPLLTRALQRFLEHTALPVGLALEVEAGIEPRVVLARAVGDRALAALEGQALPVSAAWVSGKLAALRRPEGFPGEAAPFERYGFALRLPVEGFGAILLLGPAGYTTELPLTEVFQPIVENLAKAVVLCRANEVRAARLEEDRTEARAGLERTLRDLQAERTRLQESTAELRRAQAISGTGSWTLDLATNLIRASEEAGRIAGVSHGEPIAFEAMTAAIHPDDRARVAERWQAMLRGSPFDDEHRLLVAGETKWVRSRVELERTPDGRPSRCFGAVQDITALKTVARELDRREQMYGAIARHTGLCVVVVHPATLRFVEFNDSACTTLGYTREEFAQLSVLDLQVTQSSEIVGKNLAAIQQTGSADFENQHRCKDGSVRDVWLNLQRLTIDGEDYISALWLDITERKRAEAEARRLSLVAEQSPNTVLITDLDGKIVYVNDAFTRSTGYARDEVLGRNPRILKSNKTPASTYESLWSALAAGRPWRGEFVNRRKDGSELIESANVHPLRGADGTVTGYVALKEDVTERRRAEEQLRKLSLAIEQSPESVVITNLDAQIEFVNDAFLRATGYTRAEAIGQNPRMLQSGKTPRSVFEDMWTTLSRGETWQGDLINRRKDGSEYVEHAIISPLRQPDGRTSHFVAVKADVSERYRMAEELERHRQHLEGQVQQRTAELRAIFDALPDLYFRTNREGLILDYLASHRGALYIPPEAFLGKRVQDVLPPNVGRQFKQALDRLAGGEPMVVVEYELPFSEGARSFEGRVLPLDASQAVLVVRDMTDRHKFEMALASARDAAEAANRAKSAFLANMSHEIRTPMNAIIGLTHLVRSETTSPHHRDQLDKVYGAARHLLGVINDVLDLSKIEAGKMRLEISDFDVEHIVLEVANLVCEAAREKGLELVVDVAALPARLRGDSLRLSQILMNFCSNALKFTARGHVLVRGRVLASDAAVTRVRIEVCDTGIGLTEAQRVALFQPFQQADDSTTRKFGGTGLGLAIAKRLALLLGGDVGCESVVGQGSIFWLEAPFQTLAGRESLAPHSPVLEGKRALVVDDLDAAREVAVGALRGAGLRVDGAPSGEAALGAIADEARHGDPYAIALVDADMPGLDGLETGRRIGRLPLDPRPALVLASCGAPPDGWSQAGFVGTVSKPIVHGRLRTELARALRGDDALEDPSSESSDDPAHACRERARRSPLAVLLAEDNELNREVAVELLSHVGVTVEWAADGVEAVEKARARQFDIVLMDIQMPNLNGLDATRRIRSLPGYRTAPIVAMTANAFGEDTAASIEAGMSDHVTKPVDPKALYRTLLRWWPEHARSGPIGATDAEGLTPEGQRAADQITRPDHPSVVKRLEDIDGLDVPRGLRMVGGKWPLFLRSLRQFRDLHRDDGDKLVSLLHDGDPAAARRVAHSLAGVAGLLGMDDLRAVASEVDQSMKRGADEAALAAPIAALRMDLRRIVEGLDIVLPVESQARRSAAAPPNLVDWPSLAARLARLDALLAADDSLANELHADLEHALASALGDPTAELAQKVAAFDYLGAREVIRALVEAEPRLRVG